jgi:signal transduction histidine kinase
VETNEAGDDLLRFASGQGDAGWLERARLPRWRRGEGLPGSVWETGRGAAIDDLATDDAGLDGAAMRHAGYRRASCEPLRTRGRVIGVLLLLSDAARPYEDAERELLRGLAEQAGTAIDNARVLGDVMRHSLDLEWQIARLSTERARSARDRCLLIDLAISAAGDAPPARRAEEMLERAVDLLGADAAALLSLQRAAGSLRLVAQQGLTGEAAAALRERPTGDAVLGRCLDGDPEAIVDLASLVTLQTAPWARRFGYRHVVVVACRTEGSARGVLVLGSRYAGSPGEEGRSARASVAGLLGLLLRGESESAPKEASAGPRDAAAPAAESQAPAAAPQALDLGRAADRAILAQAQQMDSLRSLAPDLALDVNNTLGAIMGHASHIRDLVPDHNPVHDKAAVIVERSKHVAALARQVLTIARGDAGGKRPIALKPLIEEVVSLLGRAFAPAITIEVRCPADLPMVQADPGKIRQALLNLAMNARDAMPEGGRLAIEGRAGHIEAMSASAVPGLVPGDYVSVVVQDNGSGMTEEVAQHVFEPFFTTKDVAQGSGLGLTVVQDIARDHQGHVTLSTAPGMGTAVRLYLPAYLRPGAGAEGGRPEESQAGRTDPAAEAPVLSALDDTSGDLGEVSIAELCVATATTLSLRENSAPDGSPAKRILVVDDEPLLRDMAAEMLRSRGYEVLLAPDGVVALEIYRQEWGRVDLVVLDMVMPRLSGLETCRRILGMDRAARILLCTGAGSDQPVQEAIREGAVGLLRKPFDMRELFAWVQKSLPL